ncbi:E3 ubiquitin-protein ligase TRAF7-like isoform X2 [Lingula anatina]|uniref:E3 ubiquitin-protein ligase TRAF7-like isoform X2 n=1 Tax=Lingula anatina TaxID=7574 RepID=A0A1S3I6K3_LINAN|nr:E3 ubiquitin-protein ligase TRAF7-like isoform X2 [Lingula anatina]|eukprot:XP_013393476.1 E3 ubiquitin-protein ligase TRAF7-like isoform X2 [Lingula anatina]
MAEERTPTRFTQPINSHLLCPLCKKLFTDPVISVVCGHTFCRACISGLQRGETGAKCPIDERTFTELVPNRAVLGQIEDLEIYCRHGLTWSEDEHEFVLEPSGCPEKINLGNRLHHEERCQYAWITCPNSEGKFCGKMRRKELEHHLLSCCHHKCSHKDKGCSFTGTKSGVLDHLKICGFRALQGLHSYTNSAKQLEDLKQENFKLKQSVNELTSRVKTLEDQKLTMSSQIENCMSVLASLQQKYDSLSATNNTKNDAQTNMSNVEKRQSRGSYGMARTTSTSSLGSPVSSPLGSPKYEKWVMPFTFKCMGTLRGHQGAVHCMARYGNKLFSSGADKLLKVWNLHALAKGCIQSVKAHIDTVHTIAVGEGCLYSAGADFTIKRWNIETLEEQQVAQSAHENVICAMVCCGEYLFTSSYATIKVWDATSLSPLHSIDGLYHWVRALALSQSKDKVYSGSHNTIEIWDSTGKFNLKGKIDHQFGSIYSLVVTQQYIIAGTYNQNIRLFDVFTHLHVNTLFGHVGVVGSLVAASSGRFLFSGSGDAVIQVWNLENNLPIMSLSRHEGPVNALTLHGDFLLSGSDDTEIKVFKHFEMQMGFTPT